MSRVDLPGALVVSLDFELAWGVRDRPDPRGNHREALLGARKAIPSILEIFEEHEIAATWAVVGFLFASSRKELEQASPTRRPNYLNHALDPYGEPVGADEEEDPIHYGSSLVEAIRRTPRQELATHTFSHFYCGEAGQTREDFRADLAAARAIAEKRGIRLRSVVFPRNQRNPDYDDILLESGISAYRGNPTAWAWTFSDGESGRRYAMRGLRLLDAYVAAGEPRSFAWHDVLRPSGLSDVRASRFLRPFEPRLDAFEGIRLERMRREIRRAARERRIYHLWWHPHNFGRHLDRNLQFLGNILEEVGACRAREGMASLSMTEVDSLARERFGSVMEERTAGVSG